MATASAQRRPVKPKSGGRIKAKARRTPAQLAAANGIAFLSHVTLAKNLGGIFSERKLIPDRGHRIWTGEMYRPGVYLQAHHRDHYPMETDPGRIYLIFGLDALNRPDYHATSGWRRGFWTEGFSFSPSQISKFARRIHEQNEIVLGNPLGLAEARLIGIVTHPSTRRSALRALVRGGIHDVDGVPVEKLVRGRREIPMNPALLFAGPSN